MRERICATYIFHNPITDETLAGSTNDAERRMKEHLYQLKNNTHPNRRFQEAHNRDPNFDFVAVQMHDKEEALDFEQALIDEFYGNPLFLNLSKNARACRIEHTPETRKKISDGLKGRPAPFISPEVRERIRQANVGRKQSDETRALRSRSMTGRSHGKETREKISRSLTGKKLSPEHVEKTREKLLGRSLSEGHKQKISAANKIRCNTDAHRENLDKVRKRTPVSVMGVEYPTIRDAALALGINPQTVHARLDNSNGSYDDWFRL